MILFEDSASEKYLPPHLIHYLAEAPLVAVPALSVQYVDKSISVAHLDSSITPHSSLQS